MDGSSVTRARRRLQTFRTISLWLFALGWLLANALGITSSQRRRRRRRREHCHSCWAMGTRYCWPVCELLGEVRPGSLEHNCQAFYATHGLSSVRSWCANWIFQCYLLSVFVVWWISSLACYSPCYGHMMMICRRFLFRNHQSISIHSSFCFGSIPRFHIQR